MGKHYPPLDQDQVETILKSLNFSPKRTESSHTQWEGYTNGIRRVVTIGHLKSRKEKYSHDLTRKMMQQSGLSKSDFYSHLE
jgi:predicted RNA binding protein YcfA (HicA-like mRNA interferase family)